MMRTIVMRTTQERTGVLYEVLNADGVLVWGRFERFGGRMSYRRRVTAAREQERVALECREREVGHEKGR